MKLLKCPSCGVVVPAIHYQEGDKKLRCYDCSTPGHPVYIEVIETKERPKTKAL